MLHMINLTYEKYGIRLKEQVKFNPILLTRIRCCHCRFYYKKIPCRIIQSLENFRRRCDIETSEYTRH